MAKRPQTVIKSTAIKLYEDFHPMSEWKEDAENNSLLVHLPDFAKEQIRITCVIMSRIVRVTAERPLADNKWSRCNEAFPIPKNCDVDKIRAKWQNGTLTITMPKETITRPHQPVLAPEEKPKTTQLEAPTSKDHRYGTPPKTAVIKSTAIKLYEDFHPMSEWKEDAENNILLVHLPDFAEEQIRITCVFMSRIGRVTAERPLADNKWSRCNEAFPIPKNCNVDKIHAKWQNGTLIITMPKETITRPHQPVLAPEEKPKTTQLEAPTSKDHQNGTPPKTAEYEPKYAKDQLNEVKRDDSSKATSSDIVEAYLGHLLRDKIAFPKAAVSTGPSNAMKQAYKKSEVPKVEDIDQSTKKEFKTPEKKEKAAGDEKKDVIAPKKNKEPKVEDIDQSTKKEFKTPEKKEKIAGDEKKDVIAPKKNKEMKSMAAAAIKAEKGKAMEQNEDKQLMINMGVAVLVIVALGAYVSYSIGSKSKD